MEEIAKINHSILLKFPASIQNLLNSLPLSDYSVLLITAAVLFVGVSLLFCLGGETKYEPLEEVGEEETGEKREARNEVKVKIPNTKKTRRAVKRKGKDNEEEVEDVQEEEKYENRGEKEGDEDWEVVKPRKPKRKAD